MRVSKILSLWLVIFSLSAIPVQAQEQAGQMPPASVVVQPVFEKKLAPTKELIGLVDFDKQAGLSSQISGLIASESIREGGLVRKGDLLVRLNTDFVVKDLEILAQQVAQLDIKIGNAQKNVARYKSLLRGDAATEKAYEDLSDNLKELLVQKEILSKTIEKRQLEITKSHIRAPFDGLILAKMKTQGEWVSPGISICTIASTKDLVARVAVSEGLIRFVHVGEAVALSLSALDKKMTGKVAAIVPVADATSKTFQVKIAMTYFDDLIQNMTVTALIPTRKPMTLKIIRRDALIRNQGQQLVYVVKEGRAVMVPVTVVAYDGAFVGVNDPGLNVGLQVVIDGNERLRPGQAVQIVPPNHGGKQSNGH